LFASILKRHKNYPVLRHGSTTINALLNTVCEVGA
jgi:hypothetical protein